MPPNFIISHIFNIKIMETTNIQLTNENTWSRAQLAKMIGICFMAMLFMGIFAEMVVRQQLIIWDDPTTTAQNIQQATGLFNAGMLTFVVILILDIFLAIGFYILFRDQHKGMAFLMVSFRLVYVAIKGAGMVGALIGRDMILRLAESELLVTQAMEFLKLHHFGFGLGLIFFGVHLLLLTNLMCKATWVPDLLAYFMFLAGLSFCFNSALNLFVQDMETLKQTVSNILVLPMTLGELLLGLWLLFRWKEQESA